MRRSIRLLVAALAFLLVGGLFVRAADPARQFQKGLAGVRANEPEKVRYHLLSIEGRQDFRSQASLLRGWLGLQSPKGPDDLIGVWADLKDALDDEQDLALTLSLMGRMYYLGGRYSEAVDVLHKALREDPNEIEAHRWLGSALYDIGASSLALEHLEWVGNHEASNAGIWSLIGLIYKEHFDFGRAAAAYREALSRQPSTGEAGKPDANEIRLELARCEFAKLEYDAALQVLRECPETADSLAVKAECYVEMGRPGNAQECVERALMQDPEHVESLGLLAKLQPAQAVERLSKAVAKKPHDYELRLRLVEACRLAGEEKLADEQLPVLDELRQMNNELEDLLVQVNSDLANANLRHRIAFLAERLDMPETAANWRRAAELLDSINRPPLSLPVTTPSDTRK